LPFFRIEFLGIYPDRIGLLAQFAVAVAPLAWKMLQHRRAGPARLEEAANPGE
jgi:hypothetical protein